MPADKHTRVADVVYGQGRVHMSKEYTECTHQFGRVRIFFIANKCTSKRKKDLNPKHAALCLLGLVSAVCQLRVRCVFRGKQFFEKVTGNAPAQSIFPFLFARAPNWGSG